MLLAMSGEDLMHPVSYEAHLLCSSTHTWCQGVSLTLTFQCCISQDSLETREEGMVIYYKGDFRWAYECELDSSTVTVGLQSLLEGQRKLSSVREGFKPQKRQQQGKCLHQQAAEVGTQGSTGFLFIPGLPGSCLLLWGSSLPPLIFLVHPLPDHISYLIQKQSG